MKDQAHSEKAVGFSTNLSVDRTRLSYERTLMSWVRTSTSLITFGFTIYKFFQIEMSKEGFRIGLENGTDRVCIVNDRDRTCVVVAGHVGSSESFECAERTVPWREALAREIACSVNFRPRRSGVGNGPAPTITGTESNWMLVWGLGLIQAAR